MGNKAQYIIALHFPTIAKACDDLPTGTLVDGEIIAMDFEGQISFNPDGVDSYRGQGKPQRSQWAYASEHSSGYGAFD